MSQNDAADLSDLPTDPSVVRRDRLLGALFTVDPEMSLLQHRPEFSLLVSPSAPPQIFLLPTRDRDAVTLFPRLVQEIVRVASTGVTPTHIVAVGGGTGVVQALQAASQKKANVAFGFHHVTDASQLVHVTGDKLDALTKAGEILKHAEAPSPQVLREALVRGLALVERDEQALAGLGGQTPVTYVLMTVCGLVTLFGYAKASSSGQSYRQIVGLFGAVSGDLVREGDLWRLFTSMVTHWDVLHVSMNMWVLYQLGQLLEPILGPRRFFILYCLSGLGSSLAIVNVGPERFSAGASGAIWGLMLAMAAIAVFPRNLLPPLLLNRLRTRAWQPLVLNIFFSFLPGIDLIGHVGGGISGFVLMISLLGAGLVPMDARTPGKSIETAPRPWLTGLAVLLGLLLLASMGIGLMTVTQL